MTVPRYLRAICSHRDEYSFVMRWRQPGNFLQKRGEYGAIRALIKALEHAELAKVSRVVNHPLADDRRGFVENDTTARAAAVAQDGKEYVAPAVGNPSATTRTSCIATAPKVLASPWPSLVGLRVRLASLASANPRSTFRIRSRSG